jgi:hypothetical protein
MSGMGLNILTNESTRCEYYPCPYIRVGSAGPVTGFGEPPAEIPQLREEVPVPHRNPTDETAHSGTLVMRVKGTENSESAASMPRELGCWSLFQVSALEMTELLKSGSSIA